MFNEKFKLPEIIESHVPDNIIPIEMTAYTKIFHYDIAEMYD